MLEISINDGDDVELCEAATKIAYVMQCSLDLRVTSYMYGGNLNDVELCKGACIITKIAYVKQCSLDLEHMVEISMMAMMLNCVRKHVYNIITKIVYAMQCS